jgi:hypothetical protein
LEEFESMLAERIDTWNQQLLHEGQRQGLQRGQAEMLLRGLKSRFGTIDAATRKRIAAASGDLLAQWADRFFAHAGSLADVFRD